MLTGCSTSIFTMDDSTEIKVEHTNETKIGRIEVKDSYTLKGEKYYVLNISLSNISITVSEKEYEKYFGLGNDAFETNVYTVNLKMDVVKFEPDLMWNTPLSDHNNTNYDYKEDSKYIYNKSSVEVARKDGEGSYDSATACIRNTRFSIFGENDFTEEEIETYKDYLRLMGKDFISSIK
jgi:hypothetical protein